MITSRTVSGQHTTENYQLPVIASSPTPHKPHPPSYPLPANLSDALCFKSHSLVSHEGELMEQYLQNYKTLHGPLIPYATPHPQHP